MMLIMAARVVSLCSQRSRSRRWQQPFWIWQREIAGTAGHAGLLSRSELVAGMRVSRSCSSEDGPREYFWRQSSSEHICYKSAWADAQHAAFEMQVGQLAPAFSWTLTDHPDPCRCPGYEGMVDGETVSKLCEQGQVSEAVEALGVLVHTDWHIPQSLFHTVLKTCAVNKHLVLGRRVHALSVWKGYESDRFLCNHMLRMYASHGRLQEAMDVFNQIAEPNAYMWSSIISSHVRHGQAKQGIQLYKQMRKSSVKADGHVFVAALQACAKGEDLKAGQQVHTDVLASGIEPTLFVTNGLVDMYAKCKSLEDARRVFDGLVHKDVVTWNAMIAGYSQQGMAAESLHLYSVMQGEGILTPNAVTFVCLLQACAAVGAPALEKGRLLHAQLREQGFQDDAVVGCSLVHMYAKCGSLEDAGSLFDRLSQKDVVTWTALIAGYSQQGRGKEALQLYSEMQDECIAPANCVTFVCLLQACACVGVPALEKGKQLHAQIREQGLQDDAFVGCGLVNMYSKCGSVQDAKMVFDKLGKKDVVTWTALIAGYSQQGLGEEALNIYSAMQQEGVTPPNSVTFLCLLQACANVGILALEKGRQLHAQIGEQLFQADVFMSCSLMNMYAKCGSIEDAQCVFDALVQKDVVTWTTLIAGYAQHGMVEEALHLYIGMCREGITPVDSVTFVCLLQACANVGAPALETGKLIHTQVGEQGLQTDTVVGCSLVNMYAKCGSLVDARGVFDGLVDKTVVTWTAMIAGYSQQGMDEEALNLYRSMREESTILPNSVTFVCLLQACASVAALHSGRQLHSEIKEKGLERDPTVALSLITMYAKSGSMVDAQLVFDRLAERDVVIWSALIAGYARQGASEVVFDLVHKMKEDAIQPDGVTFLGVLTVCSHAGLVHKGQKYFETMSRHFGITPSAEHYTCMVDLLGRAGHLYEALAVIKAMPALPHAATWHTLLGACRKWGNVEVGLHAFHEAVKINEKDAEAYVSMSNIFTRAQMWEEAQRIQTRRKGLGAWKQPGQSRWTDMDGLVHTFLVGDKEHRETEGIYLRLRQLVSQTKRAKCAAVSPDRCSAAVDWES